MDDSAVWGVLLMIYTIPYGIWIASASSTARIKERLYPGRKIEKSADNKTTVVGIFWTTGLGLLFAGWNTGAHPLPFAAMLLCVGIGASAMWALFRKLRPLDSREFRMWLAAAAAWVLAVGAWYLIFERVSELRDGDFVLLAILPPLVCGAAALLWRWARKT